ncbi:MAG TPA: copper transporter [Jatrophihabitans sp.]|jgi:hypothetical protein
MAEGPFLVISYRYHIVSVIGIFLALAVGVVIGTSALNGAVVGDLHRQVSDLKASNNAANAANTQLQARAGDGNSLAKTYGSKVVAGSLQGVTVVILGAPGATADLKNAVANEVALAGGKVTGRFQLSSAFSDPQRAADIKALATTGAHPVGLQLPASDDAGVLAGSLLGYVLFGHGQATDLTQVLTGFETLNMAKAEGGVASSGKLLMIVAPGSQPSADGAGKMMMSTAVQLATSGGATMVVGDATSAAANGLIGLVRADAHAKETVTTVDNGSTPLGQVGAILAGQQLLTGHKGQFGSAAGADSLLPQTGQ